NFRASVRSPSRTASRAPCVDCSRRSSACRANPSSKLNLAVHFGHVTRVSSDRNSCCTSFDSADTGGPSRRSIPHSTHADVREPELPPARDLLVPGQLLGRHRLLSAKSGRAFDDLDFHSTVHTPFPS